MQETIFKMRMKLWDKALQQLQQNQEYLDGAEIEAINALTNYWRKKKFGDECSADVERMVKNMIDCDKKHSNKLEVVQASKDFRGVAREMYTTDAETFKQFADYMQKTQGGPQLTEEQRRRREERQQAQLREAQQRQAQNQQQRPSTTQTSSTQRTSSSSTRVTPTQTQQRSVTRTGTTRTSGSSTTTTSGGSSTGNGGGNQPKKPWLARLLLLLAVLAGVYWIWNKFTSDDQQDGGNYEEQVIGHWNGKLQSFPATITLDSLSGNAVFGRIHVEFRNSIVTHRLKGEINQQDGNTTVRLVDIDATVHHHLNGNYFMTISANGGEMKGTYTNNDTAKQSEMTLQKQEKEEVEGLGKIPGMQERRKGRKGKSGSTSDSNKPSDDSSAKPATTPATTPQTAPQQTPQTEPAPEPQPEPEPKTGGGFRLEKVDQNQIYQGN